MPKQKIKNLILEMGGLLADYKHTWSKEMKAAFNKAIKELEKQEVNSLFR